MACASGDRALLYGGERALLASMHAKERVIAPLVLRFLGLDLHVVVGLDTDAFGTFTRTVARTGSPRDAARAKIDAAFALQPDAAIAMASEGSFSPHPLIPFWPLARELVLLVDRRAGLELVGQYATPATNFDHAVVSDVAAGLEFAGRAGFPAHGVIVMGCRENQPAPDIALIKDSADRGELASALAAVIASHGAAFVEADMRAHRNPRRMRAVGRATIDLIRRARSLCPECGAPGFGVTDRLAGLPCECCGAQTMLSRAEVLSCYQCGHRAEIPVQLAYSDAAHCEDCNP